jgi:hypothetical protein
MSGSSVESNPLSALTGAWDIEIDHPVRTGETVTARSTHEPLFGGQALLVRSAVDDPDFPDSVQLIVRERDTGSMTVHDVDDRTLQRLYSMRLDAGRWTLHRDDDSAFHQRFVGELSEDGDTIDAAWERSDDQGATWRVDFRLTYRRDHSRSV